MDRIDEEVRAALKAYNEIAPEFIAQHELALRFWSRLINNSGAVLALASAGFGSQAATVHRVSIEHFAFMYALANGTWTRDQVVQEGKYSNYQYALALKASLAKDDREDREGFSSDKRLALQDFLEDPKNKVTSAGVNIHNILVKEDLKFFHDLYRRISLHAAHANYVSASWEPDKDQLLDILTSVKELLSIATGIWRKKMQVEPDAA